MLRPANIARKESGYGFPQFLPDGKRFDEVDPTTGLDIWLPMEEKNAKPFVLVKTPFFEDTAVTSPDGKWFAYRSVDSGRPEVYVQTS